MNDETKMLEAFATDPFILMGVLADKCSEEGRDQEAAGWRWLIANERWPQCRRQYKWGWSYSNNPKASHDMPNARNEENNYYYWLAEVNKANTDLPKFLQATARLVGEQLKDKTIPDKYIKNRDTRVNLVRRSQKPQEKKTRRTYADMTPEEVAARRELRIAIREYNRISNANWAHEEDDMPGLPPFTDQEVHAARVRVNMAQEAL